MGKALYRKYRSMSLDEIVGQEHITTTLKNAIKSGAISHAYLLTGPRGVGKTSIARILAHELNGLDYTGEDVHLDIIEIDAASNRGIDEIRDLREKVHIAPTRSKYKVYIIDEVHMLTTPAFNALLKTLEEPPAHVIFILATTEVHKLPETIISRTQRYAFRPVEQAKVIDHLAFIAKQEKIKVDKEALILIAAHGEGSFRDSISLLDQAASAGATVTADIVREVLGLPQDEVLRQILGSIAAGDKSAVVRQLDALQQQGFQAALTAKQLGALVRDSLLGESDNIGLADDRALALLADLLEVSVSSAPFKRLEISLLKVTLGGTVAPSQASIAKTQSKPKPSAIETSAPAVTTKAAPAAEDKAEVTTESKPARKASPSVATTNLDELWPEILNSLKSHHNTLYGIMRMAHPRLEGDTLTLVFKYAFHQRRMNEAKHRQIVTDTVMNLAGSALVIECIFDKDVVDEPAATVIANNPEIQDLPPEDPSLVAISNIFGGGELLES
jgi:DNA polymerase-3 subunit gamma/tau